MTPLIVLARHRQLARMALIFCLSLFTYSAISGPVFADSTQASDVEELEHARQAAKQGQYVECYNGVCRVAHRGHPQAQSILGHMYEQGVGVEKDIQKSIQWYEKAAMKGVADAECRLGHIYYHGKGVPRDPKKACKWLTRAAQHNSAEAQNTLGHMYLTGDGVKKNIQTASQWLHKAAANGVKDAEQAIVSLPAVKPVTNDMGPGIAFHQTMNNIEQGWQGYGDIVQVVRQAGQVPQ
jgi:hypothetical protein